jgi:predicted methyltransferase
VTNRNWETRIEPNILITASWLQYETLKEKGDYFIEINKISDLKSVLPDVINSFNSYEQNTVNNSRVIYKLSLWQTSIKH